tara:strand:- start:346 stop:597 length:252 start_codon:yes stop_codon:yes gene_type:complete
MSDESKVKNDWEDRELGALWVHTKPDGTKYLTGSVNKEKIIIFKNKYKEENERAPDFRVYKQKAMEQNSNQKAEELQEDPDLI